MSETIILELDPADVRLLLAALAELPLKVSGDLFSKIQTQASKPKPETAG